MPANVRCALPHNFLNASPNALETDISRPCLFDGKKFDLRFIVILKSCEVLSFLRLCRFLFCLMLHCLHLQPFEAYVYNVFWIRFSNLPFALAKFDEYQRHFTVRCFVPISICPLFSYADAHAVDVVCR